MRVYELDGAPVSQSVALQYAALSGMILSCALQAGAAVVSLRRLTMFLTLEDRQDEVTPCLTAQATLS